MKACLFSQAVETLKNLQKSLERQLQVCRCAWKRCMTFVRLNCHYNLSYYLDQGLEEHLIEEHTAKSLSYITHSTLPLAGQIQEC